jgi:hypothetical protein
MKGSASAPNSATMNGTLWAIKPEMNATSRDKRHSFATATGAFAFCAFARASASLGRRLRASFPFAGLDLHKHGENLQPLGAAKCGAIYAAFGVFVAKAAQRAEDSKVQS